MPDVIEILTGDHRQVERLFEQFRASGDAAVALEICDELTVHAMIEEELVYPVASAKGGYQGLVQEAREEHDEAKGLVAQIESGVAGGKDVSDLVHQLEESVRHHVEEEESELFPKMNDAVPGIVEQMGEEVVQRRQVLRDQVAQARETGMPSTVVAAKAGADAFTAR
jgi:iron-sulfur cluster repair protein YtfE (RIC family)